MSRSTYPFHGTSARHGSTAELGQALRAALGACLAISCGFAHAPAADPPPDDRALSVGRWAVADVEWNGKTIDREFLALLKVVYKADGSWAVLFKSIPVVEGRSTNRQDESPKTFEMETLGSEGIKPKRFVGIYRGEGNIRQFCITAAGTPRPDDFSAPRHSGRMLVTLTRETAD